MFGLFDRQVPGASTGKTCKTCWHRLVLRKLGCRHSDGVAMGCLPSQVEYHSQVSVERRDIRPVDQSTSRVSLLFSAALYSLPGLVLVPVALFSSLVGLHADGYLPS